MLRQEGLLKSVDGKVNEARVHVYPEGGVGLVYCTNPGEAKELVARTQLLFRGREGVVDIILPDRFSEFGLPLPNRVRPGSGRRIGRRGRIRHFGNCGWR